MQPTHAAGMAVPAKDDGWYDPAAHGGWPLEVIGAISNIEDDVARLRSSPSTWQIAGRPYGILDIAESLENGIRPLKRLVARESYPARARLPARIEPKPDDRAPRRDYLDGWNDEGKSGKFQPKDNSASYLTYYCEGFRDRMLGRWPHWMAGQLVDAEVDAPPTEIALQQRQGFSITLEDLPFPEELRKVMRESTTAAVKATPGQWIVWDGRVWVLPGGMPGHARCPVAPGTRIRVQFRDGEELLTDEPQLLRWGWTRPYRANADILAWRMEP